MRKKTTGQMTKIVLLVSFIILIGRLLYATVVAVPHHKEKMQNRSESSEIVAPVESSSDKSASPPITK